MPQLKRRKPCGDCPFRRIATPGWLGASSPREFLHQTLGDNPMPCHMDIDYSDPQWRETQYPTASLCAGAYQFLNNWHKMPRDPQLAEACQALDQNPDVFDSPQEFFEHHARGPFMQHDSDDSLQERDWMIGLH